MNDKVSWAIVIAMVFLMGCLVGSYVEIQGRGLDGKTIEQCASLIKEPR